jgi:hypothetical protein
MMNKDRIGVNYINSQNNFTGLIGRYPCMALKSNGKFRLFTDDGWLELEANKDEIQRIKTIALRDKGSLYVNIRPCGEGYVLDERLREDAMV